MEWLVCKACGSSAMIPMDVEVDDVDLSTGEFDEEDGGEDGASFQDDSAMESGDGFGEVDSSEIDFGEDGDADAEQESRFYSCHVCGDNWLAVKEQEPAGLCQVTFIHQMGMAPVLKRVAHMQTHVVITENTVDNWQYFIDDEPTDESAWLETLKDRRRVLKSVCSN